jgi:hypothetical protein
MSMLYKLASAVLASTTGRAVAAMRFRKKERCAFGAAAVRRLLLMTGVATFLSLSLPGGGPCRLRHTFPLLYKRGDVRVRRGQFRRFRCYEQFGWNHQIYCCRQPSD